MNYFSRIAFKGKISFIVLLFLQHFVSAQTTYYQDQVYSYNEGGSISISCWVPSTDTNYVIKGVFFNGNPGNGNNLLWVRNENMQEFAKQYNFALAATSGNSGSSTYSYSGALFLRAFNAWANMGMHPDLEHAPFVTLGNSSAGAFTYGMAMLVPDRTICFCSNVPATLNPDVPSTAGLNVPGILSCGEIDQLTGNFETGTIGDRMGKNRPNGALWSKIEIQGMGHEHQRTLHLYYPFIEKCIQQRLPADAKPREGPVSLNPIALESGYLADDLTTGSGFTEIYDYEDFPADRDTAKSSWILDRDMAFLHRAYSSRDIKLHIATPDTIPWDIAGDHNTDVIQARLGDSVKIVGKTFGFNDWTKIELYHLSNKIDEVNGGGETFEFNLYMTNKSHFSRAYHVLGYNASGDTFPSHMYTILVYGGDISNPDSIPPSAPENIQLVENDMNSFTVNWDNASDNETVDGYFVFVDGVQINDSAITDTFFTVSDLAIGNSYDVYVRTKDEAGNLSVPSHNFTAQTVAPAGYTYLSDLIWESSTNGLGPAEKDMTNGDDQAGDGEIMIVDGVYYPKGLGVYGPSELVYDLGGNYSYFYSVLAIDEEKSSWVQFEIYLDGELAFTRPYDVLFADTAVLNVKGVDELKLVVVEAGNNVNYFANWAGAYLIDDSFDQDSENPEKPLGLSSSAIAADGFEVSWNRSKDDFLTTDYIVFLDGVAYDTTSLLNYTFEGLIPETNYTVSVKALDAVGHESAVSDNLSVSTSKLASVATTEVVFKVYPNPCQKQMNIQCSDRMKNISIYDLIGVKVFESMVHSGKTLVDLSYLPSGHYVVKVQLVNGTTHNELIIKE